MNSISSNDLNNLVKSQRYNNIDLEYQNFQLAIDSKYNEINESKIINLFIDIKQIKPKKNR